MADEARSRNLGRATFYLSLPFDVLAGALVGYYVAKSLGYPAELGATVGVILGTILMWLTVYREVKRAQGHAKTSKL